MRVLVIDNYDSFVYNLVQYVGDLGGRPVVYRNDQITLRKAKSLRPSHIILSPGPGTPEDPHYFGVCLSILRQMSPKVPTLGVCLGHQGIAYAFGGRVVRAKRPVHGKTSVIRHDGKGIFAGVQNPITATRYHSLVAERVTLPSVLELTALSAEDEEVMGIRHVEYTIEGVQFHPESIMTPTGRSIIKNFLEMSP